MSNQNILINFTCRCGYSEPIGVDPQAGVILEGTISVICPKCGSITRHTQVTAVVPVRIIHPPREAT